MTLSFAELKDLKSLSLKEWGRTERNLWKVSWSGIIMHMAKLRLHVASDFFELESADSLTSQSGDFKVLQRQS